MITVSIKKNLSHNNLFINNMNEHEIKESLQKCFGEGILLVVGCGLSSAEGLPSMQQLSVHLNSNVPKTINGKNIEEWEEIATRIKKGIGLEDALSKIDLSSTLRDEIAFHTANLFREEERKVINQVVIGKRILRFSELAKCLPPSQSTITVVTTNYDRLLEVACESTGLRVDTMFVGNSIKKFDRRECRYSFCRGIRRRQGKIVLEYAPRIQILKPHGSLDWYCINETPIMLNKIAANVEYMGKNYPLFYESIDEANAKISDFELIQYTSDYLKKMDKTRFTMASFIETLSCVDIHKRKIMI